MNGDRYIMHRKIARLWLFVCIFTIGATVTQAQDQPQDRIEASIDNTAPYVGQPITYTFRLYDAGVTQGKRFIAPDFAGFGQIGDPDITQATSYIDNRAYTLITQEMTIYPTLEGAVTIEPARISIPEAPFQEAATLTTEAIALTVRPLPPDAPPTFRNAIGQFDIQTDLSNTTINAGDVLTFTLTVIGTGNFETLLAPELALPDGWRAYSRPAQTQQETRIFSSKRFVWTLIPANTGTYTLPPLSFSYFDPQTGQYNTRTGTPYAVTVEASDNPFAGFNSTPIPNTPTITLKPVPTSSETTTPSPLFWMLWLLPPLAYAGIWWRSNRQQRAAKRPSGKHPVKRSQALQTAHEQLKGLQKLDVRTAHTRIPDIIYAYLSSITRRTINHENWRQAIAWLPTGVQKRLTRCLKLAYEARYAPVTKHDLRALLVDTARTLAAIEKTHDAKRHDKQAAKSPHHIKSHRPHPEDKKRATK